MNCDSTNLSAYLDHELPAPERRAVEAHLQFCPDCAATLKDLERVRTMLLTQAVPMGLHGPVIERIQNEEHRMGRRRNVIAIAVTAALFAIAVVGVLYSLREPESGPPEQLAPAIAEKPTERTEVKRPRLAQNDSSTIYPAPEPQSPELTATKLPFTLTGTLVSGDPQAVLVNNETGEQHIYRPGDTVLDGVVLRAVQQSRVVLDNNGVSETLTKGPGVIATRPSVDGRWQVAFLLDGEVIDDYGPVLTMKEVDGAIRISEGETEDFAEGRIEGRTLTVYKTPESLPAGIRGDFNTDFTEVDLSSPALAESLARDLGRDEPGNHTYALKLTRLDVNARSQDPRALMKARNDEVRAMYGPLRDYAEAHQGQFPAALAQLVPDYVQSLELYADREDRILSYFPGLELQDLSQLEPIPNCRNVSDPVRVLLLHEAKLQQIWGGPAPFAATLIEVTYGDPDQIFTLNVQGSVSGRSIQEGLDGSAAEEARWQAMIASDQNNLKQMGLVNKMFQNENWGEHTIPGFCTVYPEYLTDPGVLTSPWEESGTVSYELLFPAVATEDLHAMAIDVLVAEGTIDPNDPALNARIESQIPLMYNKNEIPPFGARQGMRNVLFLDGHVACLTPKAFQEQVGPFLR